MDTTYEQLKQEFYRLLGAISVEELILNIEISEIAATLEKKLISTSKL